MKFTPLAIAVVAIAACGSATAAQHRLRVACPPANDRHADLTAAQSASDDAVNTAATVRNEYYITSGRPYWQAIKAEGRAANYDAVFGPGAFFQNYELQGYPSY
jgi:hypothetical protein